MAPHLYAAAAAQPGAGLAALDWFAAHPVLAGILLGLAGVLGHVADCKKCRGRVHRRRQRRTTARDRVLGRSAR